MPPTGVAPDLREFLEARTAYPCNFSADGRRLLVASNLTGTMQLYRCHLDDDGTAGPLYQVTDEEEPVSGRYLPVGTDIVLGIDSGGNERTQLHLVSDDGGEFRPVAVDPEAIHSAGGTSPDGRLLAYATNRRNGVDFDVLVVDLETGERTTLWDRGGWTMAGGFSPDGRWLAVHRLTERNGDSELHLIEVATGRTIEVLAHPDDDADISLPVWSADSSSVIVATDEGRDDAALVRIDVATGRSEVVEELGWEASLSGDRAGRRFLCNVNADGWSRLEVRDVATAAVEIEVPLASPGVVPFATLSADGERVAYQLTSSVEPGDVWLYDMRTGRTTRVTESPHSLDLTQLTTPALHRPPSFDGEQVPVFLWRPVSVSERGVPVVVWIHGGPEGQTRPTWNPLIAYFVARGFAVAAPNVRGSVGYGKRYHHLDDVEKRFDAIADLAALHDWLSGHDGIDGAKAALMGGSYGGYMVLAGLAFQPERWAAGVDIVGISSLVTFLRNTSSWRRAFREREYGFLDRDLEVLEALSPMNRLQDIAAPLLVVHGANDPRVPLSEAEQVHTSLIARGVRCDLLVYPDEGHGLGKLKNRLDAWPKAADFLADVLDA